MDIQQTSTEEIVRERFESLPETIKEGIRTSDWENKIRKISEKHKLLLDEALVLEKNTFLFMLALIDLNQLKQSIKSELSLNTNQVSEIIAELENEVLHPIKQHIIDFMNKEDEETLDRDSLLKEIEDPEEIELPETTPAPANSITTPNQTAVSTTVSNNPIQNNLQNSTVTQTEPKKIDPYREPF